MDTDWVGFCHHVIFIKGHCEIIPDKFSKINFTFCWKVSTQQDEVVNLKGQCHDIQWFLRFFAGAKNGDCSRRCRGLQTWRWHCDSLVGRADSQPPTLATLSDSTVDIRQVDQETHCFTCWRRQGAVFFSGYEAKASWYPVLQGSRSAVTALSIWILYFFAFRFACFACFGDLLAGCITWTKKESAVFSELTLQWGFDDVCHCEGKCAERSDFEEGLSVCVPRRPAHWLCFVASAPVDDKDFKTQKTHLWVCRYPGYPARSKKMFRALAYVGSVPLCWEVHFWKLHVLLSIWGTVVIPTKKNKRQQKHAAHHFTKRIFSRSNTK